MLFRSGANPGAAAEIPTAAVRPLFRFAAVVQIRRRPSKFKPLLCFAAAVAIRSSGANPGAAAEIPTAALICGRCCDSQQWCKSGGGRRNSNRCCGLRPLLRFAAVVAIRSSGANPGAAAEIPNVVAIRSSVANPGAAVEIPTAALICGRCCDSQQWC